MAHLDLIFTITGTSIVQDHAYPLYAAVSSLIPKIHAARDVGIFTIRGVVAGKGRLQLNAHSALRFRLPAERIPELLPLSGKTLRVGEDKIRVGVPHVQALTPAGSQHADLVLIKPAHTDGDITPEDFLAAASRQISQLEIKAELSIPSIQAGPHAGEPRRRVLHLKGHSLIGYSLLAVGLSDVDSVRLQEHGLGGRRLMGCGLFVPTK